MTAISSYRAARIVAGVAAIAMVGVSLFQLTRASADVSVSREDLDETPITVYAPAVAGTRLPVVVIAHGFAGSQQLMTPFAVTLARNGYLAVTFDFFGHGRNRRPLAGDVTRVDGATRSLVAQTGKVVDHALGLENAGGGLALLGHSMASDVIVRYAQSDSRVAATVAVSMFSPAVTADSPPNLLIVAGELEGMLRDEALRAVSLVTPAPRAGVTYGTIADGTARRAVVADNVEHVGVLYSQDSLRESVAWLNQVFERNSEGGLDARGGAIALLLLGICVGAWPLSRLLPTVVTPARGASLGWRALLPAGLAPALATPLLLWGFPADFLGILVGGYLAMHFAVYGLLTAAALWWLSRRHRPKTGPGKASLARGLAATVLATAYTGALVALALDTYVTSFAITPLRLPLVFLMLAGTLAYFLSDEWLTRGADTPWGARVFTRSCFLLSLALAVALSFEDLFFLLIIGAVILLYFVVYGLFSAWVYRATGHPAVGATANAVAFAWALAAVFPILSG